MKSQCVKNKRQYKVTVLQTKVGSVKCFLAVSQSFSELVRQVELAAGATEHEIKARIDQSDPRLHNAITAEADLVSILRSLNVSKIKQVGDRYAFSVVPFKSQVDTYRTTLRKNIDCTIFFPAINRYI